MNAAKRFASCPATLSQASGENAVDWQRDPDWAARRDNDVADKFNLVPMDAAGDDCCPVYRQHPGTAPAVATGRLFLRLREGHTFEPVGPALEALGLGVEVALSWAPNAAWITALDGSPCHALNQLDELARLQDLVHVEAQLVLALQHR